MKIAHVGSRGFPGFQAGVEKSLEEVCPRLAARGHEITLYCSDHVATAEPVYKHTVLKRIPAVPTKHLETISRVTLSAWDAVFSGYDIVHFHSIGPALMSWIPRSANCRTLVTVHGLDWQRAKWGWMAKQVLRMGEKCSVVFPHHTVVVSKHLKRYYRDFHGTDVEYIPNGVNYEEPRPAGVMMKELELEPRQYILFASRLVPEKGCHDLIRAFRELKTDVRLVIAGASWHSDDYARTLREMAAGDPRIIFAGWVDGERMKELYSNALAYCLPSEIEGLSLALLEAMSFGACPVTSDITENLDVIENCGISFRTGDTEDLRRRLAEVIEDRERTLGLGLEARDLVRREYSWDRHCEDLIRVYEKLAGAGEGRGPEDDAAVALSA